MVREHDILISGNGYGRNPQEGVHLQISRHDLHGLRGEEMDGSERRSYIPVRRFTGRVKNARWPGGGRVSWIATIDSRTARSGEVDELAKM